MKKVMVITIVVAVGLFVGVVAAISYGPGFGPFGQGPAGGTGFGPGFGPPGFAGVFGPRGATAGLTPEQSAKIQALQEEALKEVAPLQQELFQKRAELRSLLSSKNPDETKISGLQKDVLAIQGKLQEKGTKFRLEIQKVAPELQARLGGFGPGPGFGPPGFARGRAPEGRPMW